MKRLCILLVMAVSYQVFAQTIISTSNVSGTFTLAGSPYLIQTSINVPANQVLTIEPGVVLKFIPETNFSVYGQLIANGTSVQPIIFEATDTTGWHDQNVTTGGWRGLHFKYYTDVASDQSVFNYCVVRDAKYGYNYLVQYSNAFTSERKLKIRNSHFEHNHSGTNLYTANPPLFLTTFNAADTIEVDHCIIENNIAAIAIIRTSNEQGGCTRVLHSEIHHNSGSSITGSWNNLLIEGNEIHHNNSHSAAIAISIGETTIRGNRIHHNDCFDQAAIGCESGHATIENNLICNNSQNNPSCGMTGGGGGIHLAYNEFPGNCTFDSTYYIVRNNVIANNFSVYGGGGIYVFSAKATISNNHLVNNAALSFGRAVLIVNPASEIYMKNNLFYSESTSGVVDTVQMVHILSANKIQLDYNYLPSACNKSLQSSSPFTWVGDTIHNVIGILPGMVNPTADNSILTDAVPANFNIQSSSPCINQGDTIGTFPSAVDYLNHNRIVGASIDIGAFEYGSSQDLMIEENNSLPLSIYPNPTLVNGSFMVYTPEQAGQLIIQDLSGRIVWQQEVYTNSNIISLQQLSRGIYLVSFLGKRNATGKLVVN
jgi:hypothetical protein